MDIIAIHSLLSGTPGSFSEQHFLATKVTLKDGNLPIHRDNKSVAFTPEQIAGYLVNSEKSALSRCENMPTKRDLMLAFGGTEENAPVQLYGLIPFHSDVTLDKVLSISTECIAKTSKEFFEKRFSTAGLIKFTKDSLFSNSNVLPMLVSKQIQLTPNGSSFIISKLESGGDLPPISTRTIAELEDIITNYSKNGFNTKASRCKKKIEHTIAILLKSKCSQSK